MKGWDEGVTQVVEHLPNKYEALNSNPPKIIEYII
jgi:hypothetical protein